jgi:hypothetical protein
MTLTRTAQHGQKSLPKGTPARYLRPVENRPGSLSHAIILELRAFQQQLLKRRASAVGVLNLGGMSLPRSSVEDALQIDGRPQVDFRTIQISSRTQGAIGDIDYLFRMT